MSRPVGPSLRRAAEALITLLPATQRRAGDSSGAGAGRGGEVTTEWRSQLGACPAPCLLIWQAGTAGRHCKNSRVATSDDRP